MASKTITDRFGNNYWFSTDDSSEYLPLSKYVLINGKLYKKGSDFFNNWLSTNEGKKFVNSYNYADWDAAKKIMNFAQSNDVWYTYDPFEHYNQYFRGNTPFRYRDVSQHYDLGDYVGAIQILEEDSNNILYSPKTYFIDAEGKYHLMPMDKSPLGIPRANQNKLGKRGFKDGELIITEKPKLSLKRSANGKYEVWLDNKKRSEIDESKTVYEAVQEAINMFKGRKPDVPTDVPPLGLRIQKNGGVIKAQTGILLPQNSEFANIPIETGHLTDPTKSLKNTDFTPLNGKDENFSWDQLSSYDKAEIIGLGADAASLLLSLIPGGGNIAAATIGAGSTGANFYANLRDGFQFTDLLGAGADLLLTGATLIPGAGTSASVAKLTKGITKSYKVLAPIFIGFGLVDGYQGLQNVLSGEYSIQDLRAVANGLMAIRGMVGSKRSNRASRKYGVELDADGRPKAPKTSTSKNPIDEFLDSHKGKDVDAMKKEIIDKLLKDHPELKTLSDGTPTEWVNKDTLNIESYEKAWKGLREQSSHITDQMILDSSN